MHEILLCFRGIVINFRLFPVIYNILAKLLGLVLWIFSYVSYIFGDSLSFCEYTAMHHNLDVTNVVFGAAGLQFLQVHVKLR